MRLPMFPLGNVVLPGELLPLNVFEPRYRQLVLDCLAADVAEFGVVLIERGSEVGGGDVRTSIGTLARIVRVMPLGNGRFEVVAAGVRRINVLEWLPDDPYPRGDVEDWPEAEPADAEFVRAEFERLLGRVDETRELAREVARANKQRVPLRAARALELSDDLVRAVYQLAVRAPIGPADRYRLLAAPTLESRVECSPPPSTTSRPCCVSGWRDRNLAMATIEQDRMPARRQDTSIEGFVYLVRDYAKQETLGPLKGAGKWLGFGVAGALLLGIGLALVLLGLLRLIQAEWDRAASGSLSWLPTSSFSSSACC